MKRSSWDGVCMYLEGVFDRILTNKQREVGWQMFKGFSDAAVERAATLVAESGSDRMPNWSVLFKTASGVQQHESEGIALPAGADQDSLGDDEHRAVMLQLRAKETPEQRRRADALVAATRPLPMKRRLVLASELLKLNDRVDAGGWDALLELRIREEQAKAGELAL